MVQIHSLIHTCFAPMETRISPPSSVHRLTLEALHIQATDSEVWSLGTPPIACVILTPKPESLYIGKLSTAATVRRQGLARRLMELAESRATSLNLPTLELESRVELTEVHATFRTMGFTEIDRTSHPGFDRPTSITFQRKLG